MKQGSDTPRILIAGCGYTGERCADFFCREGAEVTGLVASEESVRRLAGKPYRVVAADAADAGGLRRKFSGFAPPDILIHCLSGHGARDADAYRVTYVETMGNLLEIFRPVFCLFTSSTSVYPQNDGSTVNEESSVGGTPTGNVLLEAEQLALAAGGGVVRLGGIYGPGRTRFIEAARTGDMSSFGAPDAFINLIHVDDAAKALAHVGSRRLAGIFNAVDDHPSRRRDLARAIRQNSLLVAEDDDRGGHSTGKRVDNTKLKSSGWVPRYPSVLDALPELSRAG